MRTLVRHPERGVADRVHLDALLRECSTGVLSGIAADGGPWAVPMLHVLDRDRLLFHGSTGSSMLRRLYPGAPVVYTVFVHDSWVIGPTTFASSADYRSATIEGALVDLSAEEKLHALGNFAEGVLPGRTAEVRPPIPKELAAHRRRGASHSRGRLALQRAGTWSRSCARGADRSVVRRHPG